MNYNNSVNKCPGVPLWERPPEEKAEVLRALYRSVERMNEAYRSGSLGKINSERIIQQRMAESLGFLEIE